MKRIFLAVACGFLGVTCLYMPHFQNQPTAINPSISVLAVEPHGRDGVPLVVSQTATYLSKNTTLPDLVIWPESTFLSEVYADEPVRPTGVDYILSKGIKHLIYGQGFSRGDGRVVTQMTLASVDTQLNHVKTKLIPFGEYDPFPGTSLRSLLGLKRSVNSIRGATNAPLIDGNFRILPLICYEDYFSSCVIDSERVGRANLIVCVGNASDFGLSSENSSHLANAKWRSFESGLPMIRCYNGGKTCSVSPNGDLDFAKQGLKANFLHVRVTLSNTQPTVFLRLGYLFGPLTIVLTSLLMFVTELNKKK